MEDINQAEEYRRLEELYARMSDGEIEALSGQIEDFTDIARQVLRAEVAKRGLGPAGQDASKDSIEAARQALRAAKAQRDLEAQDGRPPEDTANPAEGEVGADLLNPGVGDPLREGFDPTAYDLVRIWYVDDPNQARQVMGLLDSAGVKAYLGPEDAGSVDDYKGSYEAGVEIKVMKFQARFALDGLRRFASPETQQDSPEDADYAVCCPKCNSQDVIFQGLDTQPGQGSAPDAKYTWTCDACGHQWKDDGIEQRT